MTCDKEMFTKGKSSITKLSHVPTENVCAPGRACMHILMYFMNGLHGAGRRSLHAETYVHKG